PAAVAAHAKPGSGKPLIPPAMLPVALGSPLNPRPSLPLQTDLQPLDPSTAPQSDRAGPRATRSAG
ncbi:MAG TPA: hypothetical protein VFC56_00995, partial [Stellaceae bacterium]|nr:hypothetical protein [Stellaceae bacterium]